MGGPATSSTGQGTDNDSAGVNYRISVTKYVDKISPELARLANWGKGKKVTIFLVSTVMGKPVVYLTIVLEDAIISGYSVSSSSSPSGNAIEALTINYNKIRFDGGSPATAGMPDKPTQGP
jgi:type VI protein secretion system component Hcp